jgi:hypothetical protein
MPSERLDKRILEKIYHNSFVKIPPSSAKVASSKSGADMVFNSYGFRSPEFKNDIDFLFSGCSVTEGWGLSKKNIWFEKFMSSQDASYASVAKSGDSVNGQVRKIFAYINQYGNPKNILCIFPDFARIQVFNSKDLFVTENFTNYYDKITFDDAIMDKTNYLYRSEDLNELYINLAVARILPNQKKNEFFKRPLIAHEVIPLEMAHMYSAQSITMLAQYCKQSGINLIWGTWDTSTDISIKEMTYNNFFNEYLDLHTNTWEYNKDTEVDEVWSLDKNKIDCHIEHSHDQEFNFAKDIQNGKHNAHFGMHRHLHYAEKFTNRIMELLNAKN